MGQTSLPVLEPYLVQPKVDVNGVLFDSIAEIQYKTTLTGQRIREFFDTLYPKVAAATDRNNSDSLPWSQCKFAFQLTKNKSGHEFYDLYVLNRSTTGGFSWGLARTAVANNRCDKMESASYELPNGANNGVFVESGVQIQIGRTILAGLINSDNKIIHAHYQPGNDIKFEICRYAFKDPADPIITYLGKVTNDAAERAYYLTMSDPEISGVCKAPVIGGIGDAAR